MAKVKFAMKPDMVDNFAKVKNDIIVAKKEMTEKEIRLAKDEVYRECSIYDSTPDEESSTSTISDYEIINGRAVIPVKGMLVNQVNFCSAFFGEVLTTYRFIQDMVAKANEDPAVEEIILDIDSGGGYVDGVYETYLAILNSNKKVIAMIGDTTASAAYWLASAADEVVVVQKTGFIGSIGVVVEYIDRKEADAKDGYRRVTITNTSSQDKRPDLDTDEGLAVLLEELDAIYGVFKESILAKRSDKLSSDSIDSLSGRVFIAEKALELGLVDRLSTRKDLLNSEISGSIELNRNRSARADTLNEEGLMSLKEILAENPDAKAEYEKDIAAARAEGQKASDERVQKAREDAAEIVELSGGTLNKTALAAIKDGTSPEAYSKEELKRVRSAGIDTESVDIGSVEAKKELVEEAKSVDDHKKEALDEFHKKKISDLKNKKGAK